MKIYYSYMYFYVIIFVNKLLRNFIKAVHQNIFLTQNTQNAPVNIMFCADIHLTKCRGCGII